MVCKLSLVDGKVHFHSKFVKSKHRCEEENAKRFLYPGQMGTKNPNSFTDTFSAITGMFTGKLPKLKFRNPSNTNAFYWGGKVCCSRRNNVAAVEIILQPSKKQSVTEGGMSTHL